MLTSTLSFLFSFAAVAPTIVVALGLATLVHEMGHALAVLLLGGQLTVFGLGWASLGWELRWAPDTGWIVHRAARRTPPRIDFIDRTKAVPAAVIAIAAAGSLLNLVFAAAAAPVAAPAAAWMSRPVLEIFWRAGRPVQHALQDGDGVAFAGYLFSLMFAVANAFMVANLCPFHRYGLPSDGQIILNTLRRDPIA